ncbi:zf-HC2 domain-containing protein [Streptomyces sp. NBC_01310]|uniref:anti-sigma factor family protein n=1 Tax=Streptomyces sp. NBC_01310 TaxID=2903820 RepID=UPI0035B67839|nr:zf-HC2 domain-containing protein [Streptomyces sp. NBC_01310]
MNCDEFVELVTSFLDGAMEEPTELDCLAHLARCEGCEASLEQFRQTIAILGELPRELPGASLSVGARDQLRGAFRAARRV